jgi:hypothetical protein
MAGSSRCLSASCSPRHSGHAAGEDARGLEALHPLQHRFALLERHAQAISDLGQLGAEVAALVDPIDQRRADQALAGVEAGQHQLVLQVL